MSDSKKKKGRDISWGAWTCVALGIGILVFAFGFTIFEYNETPADYKEAALRGDFYGGHLNAFASIAATFLFLAALLFQSKELRYQREELILQREELIEARKVFEGQRELMAEQTQIAKNSALFSKVMQLIKIQQLFIEQNTEIHSLPLEKKQPFKEIEEFLEKAKDDCEEAIEFYLKNSVIGEDERDILNRLSTNFLLKGVGNLLSQLKEK